MTPPPPPRKTIARDVMKRRGKEALIRRVEEEEHVEIYGGVREGIEMKTYLQDPMHFTRKSKLPLRVGDWTCQ